MWDFSAKTEIRRTPDDPSVRLHHRSSSLSVLRPRVCIAAAAIERPAL